MADTKLEITVKAASPAPRDNGTNIPKGNIARAGNALQKAVDGWLDGWFGPGEALPPMAPPGTQVRTLDYDYGLNLQTTRPYARISYHSLREFSRAYPLLRMAIEKVKDRICSQEWTMRVCSYARTNALPSRSSRIAMRRWSAPKSRSKRYRCPLRALAS